MVVKVLKGWGMWQENLRLQDLVKVQRAPAGKAWGRKRQTGTLGRTLEHCHHP